jgi:hypothetical protein
MSRKKKEAEIEMRRKVVAANLLAGLNYREMGDALGVSVGTIKTDVDIIIGRWQREQIATVAQYVALGERRLDRALNAIWPMVQDGKFPAIDRLLKIEERRAKMRGTDAPEKVEHSGSVTQRSEIEELNDTELEQLVANLIRASRAEEIGGGPAGTTDPPQS